MKKRILGIALAVSMLFSMIPIKAEQNEECLSYVSGFVSDFETDQPESGNLKTTSGTYTQIDKEHEKSIAITSGAGNANAYFYAENPKPYETSLISLDVHTSNNTEKGYLEIFEADDEGIYITDDAHLHRTIYFRQTGKVAHFKSFNRGGDGTGVEKKYSGGEWYHFDIWIDTVYNKVFYYMDGELFGETELPESFDRVGGFRYIVESGSGGSTHSLDNVKILYFQNRGKKLGLEGITAPENFELPVSMQYDTAKNNFGFIYNGLKAEFTLSLYNGMDRDSDVTVKATSVDNTMQIDDVYETKIIVPSGEFIDVKLPITLNRYGYHTLTTELISEAGETFSSDELIFTNANMPEKGVQNKKISTGSFGYGSTHLKMKAEDVGRKMELLGEAGYGGIRRGIAQQTMSKDKDGNYILDEASRINVNYLESNNLGYLCILDAHSSEYESPPVTEAGFAEWRKYAEGLVNEVKDTVDCYEIFNEYNGPMFNLTGGTPEDYVRLCKETYPIIKKLDPTAKVFVMAAAPVHEPNEAQKWMREVFENGITQYMDGISIHTYVHDSAAPEMALADRAVTKREKLLTDTIEMMKEFGCENKPLISTEVGWSVSNDAEERQGKYMVRYAVANYDRLDEIYWFTDQKIYTSSGGENAFGVLREDSEVYSAPYPANSARPGFLAMCYYNRVMADATLIGKVECNDKDLFAYRFKLRDGNEALIVWNLSGKEQTVAFKTEAASAELSDLYGNSEMIDSLDGSFTFDITDEPVYLIGILGNTQQSKVLFGKVNDSITICENESAEVAAFNNSQIKTVLDFRLPANITASAINGTNAVLNAGDNGNTGEVVRVLVKEAQTGKIYYSYDLPVTYEDTLSAKFRAMYFRNGRWYCVTDLKNNSTKESISGNILIKSDELGESKVIRFDTIIPGDERHMRLILPANMSGTRQTFSGEIRTNTGDVYNIEDEMYFAGFKRMEKRPVVDGVLDDWNLEMPIIVNKTEQYFNNPKVYLGEEDLSGKIYGAYDDKNFYLAAQVTDDTMYSTNPNNYIWACDSIQFAFANIRKISGLRTEYSVGMLNGTPQMKRETFMVVDTGIVDNKDAGIKEPTEIQVTRNGNITTYEMKIPWTEIYGQGADISSMKEVIFSVLINDNDGNGRKGWLEFCPGIGSSKNAASFMLMPLL